MPEEGILSLDLPKPRNDPPLSREEVISPTQ